MTDKSDKESYWHDVAKQAVDTFIVSGDPARLLELFNKGFPLHKYPESRELIEKILQGDSLRPFGRGGEKRTFERLLKEFKAVKFYFNEMQKPGKKKKTIVQLEAARMIDEGMTADNFRKTILPRYADNEFFSELKRYL